MIVVQLSPSCWETMLTVSPANEAQASTWTTAWTSDTPVSTSGLGLTVTESPQPVAGFTFTDTWASSTGAFLLVAASMPLGYVALSVTLSVFVPVLVSVVVHV